MDKTLTRTTFALVSALGISASASAATDANTRYVWAENLTVRAAPDVKSEAVARLPLGTSVQLLATNEPLVHREESVPGLKLDHEAKGKPLKIVGDWRRVQAGSVEGWVFDGYLSRYAYPKANKGSDKVAMEFAAAKATFGYRAEQQWITGDGKDTALFQAMPQRLQDEAAPQSGADISWDRVSFATGGTGELAIDSHDAGTGWTVELNNLPMTYQEAVLWAKRWGWFGEYGVALQEGHARLRYDYDDLKADLDYNIECQASTCNIRYSLATE